MCTKQEVRNVVQEEVAIYEKKNQEQHSNILKKIEENTEIINSIAKDTKGLVTLWNDALAVGRINGKLLTFTKWIGSLAIIGAIIHWLKDHFTFTG